MSAQENKSQWEKRSWIWGVISGIIALVTMLWGIWTWYRDNYKPCWPQFGINNCSQDMTSPEVVIADDLPYLRKKRIYLYVTHIREQEYVYHWKDEKPSDGNPIQVQAWVFETEEPHLKAKTLELNQYIQNSLLATGVKEFVTACFPAEHLNPMAERIDASETREEEIKGNHDAVVDSLPSDAGESPVNFNLEPNYINAMSEIMLLKYNLVSILITTNVYCFEVGNRQKGKRLASVNYYFGKGAPLAQFDITLHQAISRRYADTSNAVYYLTDEYIEAQAGSDTPYCAAHRLGQVHYDQIVDKANIELQSIFQKMSKPK